jgi:hypothetical protein
MGFAQRFDQWNQRQAERLSPRTCGWIVYSILILCALSPSIIMSFMFGIWAFFPTIIIMLGFALPFLPWLAGDSPRNRTNRRAN